MAETATILVIDDEENLRRTLTLILKRQGYAVDSAGTIKEARQRMQSGNYDLVFLDLKLPDASGLSLLPELRRDHPDMPVLVLTAHDRLEAATDAVLLGAHDFLLKPVDPSLIIQRVKEVLAEKSKPRKRKEYAHLRKLLKEQKLEGDVDAPQEGKKD